MAAIAETSGRGLLPRIANVIRRVIGVPDYDAYLAHLAAHHPDEVPLTQDAFARDALTKRYAQAGSRCC